MVDAPDDSLIESSISAVQSRLIRLGYDIPEIELSELGPETKRALGAYQEIHGLAVTCEVDTHTWNELITSSYRLGDRLLYERQPMFRGDDVSELQHRLNSLGFDSGREDGIFRTQTAQALRDFQRNMAISSDGICGPNTVIALARVSTFAFGSATNIREKLRWQLRKSSENYRVGISIDPSFTVVGDRLIKELFELGMKVPLYCEEGDQTDIASQANENNIDFLFSIAPSFSATGRCIFFSNSRYRSLVGASLAGSIQHELSKILKSDPDDIAGRMYPLLRSSQMPSVIIELCDTSDISMIKKIREQSTQIAAAIAKGIYNVVSQTTD